MIQAIVRIFWGTLDRNELKKYSLLGLGFFFLIGSWWPLKILKDSIFVNTVGPLHLPVAKMVSLCLFFPLILFYSKLVDHFAKEKLIYFFIAVYSMFGFLFVYYLNDPVVGLQNATVSSDRLVGWLFYFFTESFISLMLSLYWSFINDITTPKSAQRGYSLIVFGTQLGGLVFTILGNILSADESQYATRAPLIVFISIVMFFMVGFVIFLLKKTSKPESFEGFEDAVKQKGETMETVGFLDGLKTLLTHPYVAGIFVLVFFQEFISTMLGFQLSLLVKNTIQDPGLVNKFLFNFGMYVQIIACSFALIGTSFFQRYLGVRFCLILYPALLGCCITGYMFYPSFRVIFVVMLIVKALGYTLNRPASEMLYIPTSRNIKYKSKAWIEMFGTRFSKAAGSVVNQFVGPIVLFTGSLSLVSVVLWIILAGVLGNTFSSAVHNEKLIE